VGNQLGNRNTPGLANLAWMPDFFWDGGFPHLEQTPLNALENPVEMGETMDNVLARLNKLPAYQTRTRAAFGQDTLTRELLLKALTQFTGMLVSANSRYDHYVRKENGVTFTPGERAGMALFQTKCASCHATDLFTDHSFRNNGLDTVFADKGREAVTGNAGDRGKFKVPSLRNVALTMPYMHDGRFANLRQVLNHYASGVKYSPTLDPLLQQDGKPGIAMTEEEKNQLFAFLQTLTDPKFINDKRFNDPVGNSNDQ
jgi:cytochrome c peroxidase